MKRDIDLIRKILLTFEKDQHGTILDINKRIDGYTEETIGYHCYLLIDAGLCRGDDITVVDGDSPNCVAIGLTWAGHEFIDNARNPAIWRQVKRTVGKLEGVSFAILTAVLTEQVKHSLGVG